MSRDRQSGMLGCTSENVSCQRLQSSTLRRGPRLRHLRAYHAALDDVDAILLLVPFHCVHKRKLLDRKSKSREILPQIFQSFQLSPQTGCSLELKILTGLVHLIAKGFDRTIRCAVEKRSRERDTLIILRNRASTHARAQTFPDFVPNTSGRARGKLKQLLLIAEMHLHISSTIAQHQHVTQLAQRFFYALRSKQQTVENRGVCA